MVSKEEILKIINNKKLLDDYLIKCFKAVDTDNSGYVDFNELQKMIFNVSNEAHVHKPNQDKVNKIFDAIDKNKDGKISCEEFCSIARKNLEKMAEENKK